MFDSEAIFIVDEFYEKECLWLIHLMNLFDDNFAIRTKFGDFNTHTYIHFCFDFVIIRHIEMDCRTPMCQFSYLLFFFQVETLFEWINNNVKRFEMS